MRDSARPRDFAPFLKDLRAFLAQPLRTHQQIVFEVGGTLGGLVEHKGDPWVDIAKSQFGVIGDAGPPLARPPLAGIFTQIVESQRLEQFIVDRCLAAPTSRLGMSRKRTGQCRIASK